LKTTPASTRRPLILSAAALSLVAALILSFPSPGFSTGSYSTKTTLLQNQSYAETLLRGIREARREIIFTFYLFKMTESRGNSPREIATELVKAKKRGVDVTVILEEGRNSKDPLNAENRATAQFLSRSGVKVFFDSPRVTTHAKVAVIDSRFVYLGSHNLTQSALRHNNELSILLDSPEIAAEVKSWLDHL
jgi:phosphatidylserine/phosphatidylglycerophosphate/cardiolipin synthase-like enzyme